MPLNVQALTTLAEGPHSLYDLRRALGSPPQTTMRGHLRKLVEIGVLDRWQSPGFPGSVEYSLGAPGRDLLSLAELVQRWLDDSPDGRTPIGAAAAKSALKALVDGWSSGIIRILAARPLSLTELNAVIPDLNYPSLERRLGAMRFTGQVEAASSGGRGTPYRASRWLRRAMIPLIASMRWEREHLPSETSQVGRVEVESAFLLAVPVLRLAPDSSGICRLAVEVGIAREGAPAIAGVLVTVEEGRVVSCISKLGGEADAWVSGTSRAWMDGILEGQVESLEIGGDCSLARDLLDGLHLSSPRAKQGA